MQALLCHSPGCDCCPDSAVCVALPTGVLARTSPRGTWTAHRCAGCGQAAVQAHAARPRDITATFTLYTALPPVYEPQPAEDTTPSPVA
ncbi:hypothetical protein [Nonomuraea sp. NPDC023979]|uniref:hypothetical protein n=1 Tax=Nonomuraea sp. NPDC023979 TaxID=3154796 RepID=UPI0033F67235